MPSAKNGRTKPSGNLSPLSSLGHATLARAREWRAIGWLPMRRLRNIRRTGRSQTKNSARTGRKHCRAPRGWTPPTLRASIDLPSDKLSGPRFRADVAAVTNENPANGYSLLLPNIATDLARPYVTGTFSFVSGVARSEIDSKRSASTLQLSNFPSVGESSMASEPIRDTD